MGYTLTLALALILALRLALALAPALAPALALTRSTCTSQKRRRQHQPLRTVSEDESAAIRPGTCGTCVHMWYTRYAVRGTFETP